MVPSPVPEGVTVHHVWSLVAVHAELEVTVNEVELAAGDTFRFDGVTDKVGETVLPVIEILSTAQE
jgi:hypothetical protein